MKLFSRHETSWPTANKNKNSDILFSGCLSILQKFLFLVFASSALSDFSSTIFFGSLSNSSPATSTLKVANTEWTFWPYPLFLYAEDLQFVCGNRFLGDVYSRKKKTILKKYIREKSVATFFSANSDDFNTWSSSSKRKVCKEKHWWAENSLKNGRVLSHHFFVCLKYG